LPAVRVLTYDSATPLSRIIRYPGEETMNIRGNRSTSYKIFISTCAMLALGQAAPSLAGSFYGHDVSVRYSDLDVDTVEGATTLLKRINAAAKSVCAPIDHGSLSSQAKREACQGKLTAAAVARVDRPLVLAVYESTRPMPRIVSASR
jgi:UrcA family protein